jgi:hypothetical protein
MMSSPQAPLCVILVPFATHIHPACEEGLRDLERRGYYVRRVGGCAAIDQGRSQMATDALAAGFDGVVRRNVSVSGALVLVNGKRTNAEAFWLNIRPWMSVVK